MAPAHPHADTPLDFFVLFSSAASMFGPAGQATRGRPTPSSTRWRTEQGAGVAGVERQLGGVVGGGRGDERHVSERLSPKGIAAIEPQQGWRALEMVFKRSRAQVGVIPINWKQWRTYAKEQTPPLVSALMQESAEAPDARAGRSDDRTLREQLLKTEPGERLAVLRKYLCQQVARTLRADASTSTGRTGSTTSASIQ